jgi:hypothetical protein
MIFFLIFVILVLTGIIYFLLKKLITVSEELIKYDNDYNNLINSLNHSEIIIHRIYDSLDKISQNPIVFNDPIVTQLISLIKVSKNDIKSILDSIGENEEENNE